MTDRRVGDDEEIELATEPVSERLSGPTTPAVVPEAKARAVAADEDHPYVDDRVSKVWVALILLVFAGIVLYGLLFGKAGMLSQASPSPSPTPSLSATPSVTISPSPGGSPSAAPSVSPTGSPGASPTSGSPSPTSAPSTSPAAT